MYRMYSYVMLCDFMLLLYYVTLRCVRSRYVMFCYVTVRYVMRRYLTLGSNIYIYICITLCYATLYYVMSCYVSLCLGDVRLHSVYNVMYCNEMSCHVYNVM